MCLDSKQIKLIESDVESARITLNHLANELVDHICCEVENMMNEGEKFEEAYRIIKEQTGIKVLQKIQENTLYLIDKKYALMKTTMKITGNVSLAVIAIGTVMKIYRFPGWPITLMIGFALLCFVFFPAALYLNYSYKTEKKKPLLHLSILIGGILFMIGVLFKVMHWPGSLLFLFYGWSIILLLFLPMLLIAKLKEVKTAKEKLIYVLGMISLIIFEFATMAKMFHWPGAGFFMLIGSVLLIGTFLPLFTAMKIKQNQINTGQFIFIITISMFTVILTMLLSFNVSQPVLECFTNEDINNSKILKYYEAKHNQELTVAKLNSDTTKTSAQQIAIIESADKLTKIILELKLNLVQEVEQVDKNTAVKLIADPQLIERKDNYDRVNMYLRWPEENKILAPLKEELNNFKKLSIETTSVDPDLSKTIESLFDTSDKKQNEENITWEEANFRNTLLIGTLARLSDIEKNVRIVESLIIK